MNPRQRRPKVRLRGLAAAITLHEPGGSSLRDGWKASTTRRPSGTDGRPRGPRLGGGRPAGGGPPPPDAPPPPPPPPGPRSRGGAPPAALVVPLQVGVRVDAA